MVLLIIAGILVAMVSLSVLCDPAFFANCKLDKAVEQEDEK